MKFGKVMDAHWTLAADQPLKIWIFENPRWRWPPSWKITKNRDISAMVWLTFTKFGMLMQNGPLNISTVKNLNFTNPRWWTVAILKTVKFLYLCNRLTDFDEIWHGDAHWPLTVDWLLKFRIFENTRWRRYICNDLTDVYEIWYIGAKWVSQPLWPLKSLNLSNPRWQTAAILKTVKSPYLCNLLIDFD